jgi:hypothetical protein
VAVKFKESPIVDMNKAISQVWASKYLKSTGVKTPERQNIEAPLDISANL